ncbi:MAG: 1,4-dihydroxy-2-naphthoate octaprenyltransferase [Candidatus Bathyarchaeia archaeon]
MSRCVGLGGLQAWLVEMRLPFLTASVIPVLLGTAVAWATTNTFLFPLFILTLLGGVCLHIGTNVANDYFDHKSRDDDVNVEFVRPFSGGSRMIQLGMLTPRAVLSGALLFFAAGGAIGLYLALARGFVILIFGLIGVFSGFFYTAPPFNLASRGIGELFVGLNFGVMMTAGAFYVQTQALTWEPVFAAIPVSMLITAVLYINEFPDYTADKTVGKRHLVVRLGRRRAAVGYGVLMTSTYFSIFAGVGCKVISPYTLLGILTLPFAVRAVQHAKVYHSEPSNLAPANASTIITHLTTGLLLTVGYILEGIKPEGTVYIAVVGVISGLTVIILFVYRQMEHMRMASLGTRR